MKAKWFWIGIGCISGGVLLAVMGYVLLGRGSRSGDNAAIMKGPPGKTVALSTRAISAGRVAKKGWQKWTSWHMDGLHYKNKGKFQKALYCFRQAIVSWKADAEIRGSEHGARAEIPTDTLFSLGYLYTTIEKPRLALAMFDRYDAATSTKEGTGKGQGRCLALYLLGDYTGALAAQARDRQKWGNYAIVRGACLIGMGKKKDGLALVRKGWKDLHDKFRDRKDWLDFYYRNWPRPIQLLVNRVR